MFSIFLALLILILVIGVVSVIKPGTNKKTGEPYRRKDLGLGFSIFVVILCILAGITAPKSKTVTLQQASVTKSVQSSGAETQAPTVTTKQETESQVVPYTTQDQDDSSLAKGQTKIAQPGQNGTELLTYDVTYSDGVQTDKTLVSTSVTTPAVTQIIDVGTYVAPVAAPSQSCYPLSDEGTCYEPGEYCRDSDQGTTGLAGDGETITCENNDGLRWEPS